MINKQEGLVGPILHPVSGGGHQTAQRRNHRLQVVICRVRIHHHAIVPAAFVKIAFLKGADFDR